jgi:hypothetical protein
MPLAGVSPGYRLALPPLPEGAGEEAGGRAGWGLRGGIYEFRHLVRGGGYEEGSTSSATLCGEGAPAPSPVPSPQGRRATTVHCTDEAGNNLFRPRTQSASTTPVFVSLASRRASWDSR